MADQQPAPGSGFSKRHVSGMLKHLADDEQRAKAQEVAAVYKKLFAEKKWEAVLGKMQRVVDEDNLRVLEKRRPARLLQAGQALFAKSPMNAARTTTTPRERWDITSRGPATPLSPTPTGNAFANGGFWEQLTPKTPVPKIPVTKTPLTAIGPASPFSPIVPQDHEARTAYKHVKDEVDAMARSICANRMSVYSSVPSDSSDVPRTLLSTKDVLKAAEITLGYHQLPLSLTINPALPKVTEGLARDEKAITLKFTVQDSRQLMDVDEWLHIDPDTLEFHTILDAQRDRTRMLRHRRKSNSLEVSEQAVQQAWATRILEDAERAYYFDHDEEDGSENSDETEGYDYSNFLQSIKSSTSDLTRDYPDLASLRSSAMSRDTLTSHRSSISPRKLRGTLELTRESTYASQPNSLHPSPTKIPYTSSRSSTSPRKPAIRERRNTLEDIETQVTSHSISHIDFSTPQLSPEDRAVRRKAASSFDLDAWALELKIMEEKQKRHKAVVSAEVHPAFRVPDAEEKREGSGGHGKIRSDLPLRRYAGSAHLPPRHPSQPENDLNIADINANTQTRIPPPPSGYRYVATSQAWAHGGSKSHLARDGI
jgi:hypothetical protein